MSTRTRIDLDQQTLLDEDIKKLEEAHQAEQDKQKSLRASADILDDHIDRLNVQLMALRVGRHELTKPKDA